MRFKFNLRVLLFAVAVAAVLVWGATQFGMVYGEFEVTKTNLVFNESGRANGSIQWRFIRVTDSGTRWGDAVCQIQNVPQGNLANWKVGDRVRVKYRLSDVGPLKKENPYQMFMTKSLGIHKDDIGGQVMMEGWSQIMVKGKLEDPLTSTPASGQSAN